MNTLTQHKFLPLTRDIKILRSILTATRKRNGYFPRITSPMHAFENDRIETGDLFYKMRFTLKILNNK